LEPGDKIAAKSHSFVIAKRVKKIDNRVSHAPTIGQAAGIIIPKLDGQR
jgi:hypothetical protein